MWDTLVDRHERVKPTRHGVKERPVIQTCPTEIRGMLNLGADQLAAEPFRYARVEQHSRLRFWHQLGCDRFRKERRLRHLKNGNCMFPSHAREVHEKVVK